MEKVVFQVAKKLKNWTRSPLCWGNFHIKYLCYIWKFILFFVWQLCHKQAKNFTDNDSQQTFFE